MCDLERRRGIRATKFMGMCCGLYEKCISSCCDGEVRYKCFLYNQCANCKKYIHLKWILRIRDIALLVFLLFIVYVLGTPEGVIRCRIWMNKGMEVACTCKVEKLPHTKKVVSNGMDYRVEIGEEEEIWGIIEFGHTYIVSEKNIAR